ncbi:Endoglucanase EG-II [Tulasnella sp. 425]|nr:Endoglucanase EG-II [Tulasnella sp. 425]
MKSSIVASTLFAAVAVNAVGQYQQCGGIYYTGSTTCDGGWVCTFFNDYYSQCLAPSSTTTTTTTSSTRTTTTTTSTTTSSADCSQATSGGSGTLQYTGVNIAGFDFGCITDGTCDTTQTMPPLTQYTGVDGAGQMQHFVSNGMNIFRLPVGWQVLTPTLGGTLDATNLAEYDALVEACLNTGAHCIIDIHNYARWNGNIIDQSAGAVTTAQFVSLWTQIATKYASQSKVVFGVMNEPHDVPDITAWAATVQAVVTAIRNAGATSQLILLPGNNWTSAETFVSNGSAAALSQVKNPDGSITGLIFDVHKYLDSDNSGTHAECVTDNIQSSFLPLSQWLRCNGRQAFLSETGGGNVQSCVTDMCSQLSFLKHNSDVFLGYAGWSAGSFLHPHFVLPDYRAHYSTGRTNKRPLLPTVQRYPGSHRLGKMVESDPSVLMYEAELEGTIDHNNQTAARSRMHQVVVPKSSITDPKV